MFNRCLILLFILFSFLIIGYSARWHRPPGLGKKMLCFLVIEYQTLACSLCGMGRKKRELNLAPSDVKNGVTHHGRFKRHVNRANRHSMNPCIKYDFECWYGQDGQPYCCDNGYPSIANCMIFDCSSIIGK